jgi:hypothetical protein
VRVGLGVGGWGGGGGGGGGGGVYRRPVPRSEHHTTFMCLLSGNLGALTS